MTIESGLPSAGIGELDTLIEDLPPDKRALFQRIFKVRATNGEIRPPKAMDAWIAQTFGSVEATTSQRIVRVTNVVTMEDVLYNRLRARRPIEMKERLGVVADLMNSKVPEPFDDPVNKTPEDEFGRVVGRSCITGANIAKYDGWHGLVILREANPLRVSRDQFGDMMDTGKTWADKAHAADPAAQYYFFLWNCLWRAGASLVHAHAQVVLGKGMHYGKIESLRRTALAYREQYGSSYFDDLYAVHESLGLAFEHQGIRMISYLTPVKEKEIIILAPACDEKFKDAIYLALSCFRNVLNAITFNLGVAMPPLGETTESWEGFPIVARLVDRGDATSRSSDFGTMELYAASIISSDPFRVANALKAYSQKTAPQPLESLGASDEERRRSHSGVQ